MLLFALLGLELWNFCGSRGLERGLLEAEMEAKMEASKPELYYSTKQAFLEHGKGVICEIFTKNKIKYSVIIIHLLYCKIKECVVIYIHTFQKEKKQ